MTYQIIWTPGERVLWMFHISIALLGSFRYFKNAQRADNPKEKTISLGFFLFMLLTSIGYIFFYLARFYHEGTFNGVAYMGTINDSRFPASLFITLGTSLYNMGMVIFIFAVELVKRKSKFILTILAAISYMISVISRWTMPQINSIYTLAIGLLFLIFVITFLYLTMSVSEVQNMALFMLTGYVIIVIGAGFQLPESLATGLYPPELFPSLYIIGSIFMLLPLYIDAETFLKSKPAFFWGIFVVAAVSVFSLALLFFFLTGVFTYLMGILVSIILLLLTLYLYSKTLRLNKEEASFTGGIKKGDGDLDILNVFARPKKVTEEEVFVSKERKICLVCKGKVARYDIYICPKCDSLYHQKCAKTLESQENACWACDAPFDESKPVQLDKKEEVELGLRQKKLRGGKNGIDSQNEKK